MDPDEHGAQPPAALTSWPPRTLPQETSTARARRRRGVAFGIGGTVLAGGMAAAGYAVASSVTAAPSAAGGDTAAHSLKASKLNSPGAAAAAPNGVSGVSGSSGSAAGGGHRFRIGFGAAGPAAGGLGGGPPAAVGVGAGAFGPRGAGGAAWLGLFGVVTATSSSPSSITITEADGTSIVVSTTSSTTYRDTAGTTTASSVQSGDDVRIEPTAATAASSTPTAAQVLVEPPTLTGTVVSVSANAIVVRNSELFEQTIHVSATTTYSENGTTVQASAVTAGEDVVASGTLDADQTSLDASSVRIVELSVTGTVSSVIGSTIELDLGAGSSLAVTTSSSTSFTSGNSSGGSTSSLSAVKSGDHLLVTGLRQLGGAIAARSVRILPAGAGAFGPPAGARRGGWSGPSGGTGPGPAASNSPTA
jgi:hypothetical protein